MSTSDKPSLDAAIFSSTFFISFSEIDESNPFGRITLLAISLLALSFTSSLSYSAFEARGLILLPLSPVGEVGTEGWAGGDAKCRRLLSGLGVLWKVGALVKAPDLARSRSSMTPDSIILVLILVILVSSMTFSRQAVKNPSRVALSH